ncbi:MAG: Rpn family recombination-promoting nuclease/putative transposase, partial [Gammaproteobacteria bacterium]|nr:Rpn family recombination-promoting nuclease/putative transposase [Gammaproteobacteria bacterium]
NTDKTIDGIQLVLLELPKFKPKTINEKKLTVLWLRFLTEIDRQTETVDQELLEVPEIKAALALTEESAYTAKELEAYERNWDAIRSEKTLMEDKWEEGLEKGREEGREEGVQAGLIRVAKNLLKGGFELSVIAQNTGLSMEVLKKLKAETKH